MTYFFVPDMTGIDLAEEDAAFMRYLAENGWEGEVGEDDDRALVSDSVEKPISMTEEGESERGHLGV